MSTIYYDFQTKKVIDPLESITSFYVNPYMPESAKMLNLEQSMLSLDVCNVSCSFVKGIPVFLLPISLLNLSRVHVTFSSTDDDKVVIRSNRLKIYLKLFKDDPTVVRVDSVLYS